MFECLCFGVFPGFTVVGHALTLVLFVLGLALPVCCGVDGIQSLGYFGICIACLWKFLYSWFCL